MTAYLDDNRESDGSLVAFERVSLSANNGRSERWLQERLFSHPSLLPIVEMFGYGEDFVPLCRELPLRYGSSKVFLDLLGVSPTGKLVLVECKLWRNPEARREVVAQLFEYASLLAEWTYSDLEARLKHARGLSGDNPIFHAVRSRYPALDEAAFVDAVNRSLAKGDFLLVIAGDGIRSDLHALRRSLASQAGLLSRVAFVEIKILRDAAGRTLLVPFVPLQTEIVKREVFVSIDGHSVERLSSPTRTNSTEPPEKPSTVGSRLENRAFWDKFIAAVEFDHPDQSPPRHGGNNWVKIDMPGPVSHLVAYREAASSAGFALKFVGQEGREALEILLEDQSALEQEIGVPLHFEISGERQDSERVVGVLLIKHPTIDNASQKDEAELAWLCTTANKLVNALRPRLAAHASL
ncbi:hypothetical protein [Caballeronia sp. AZ7_KS35]|uniref:hypothetical protein n=1 Tax=Caballeronia sp. AZ7_KS35 TaxID=2921762 RepID=UPI002027889C|nr:hypothetical protein [Caballeronia sp. AZ7_KS35]